MGCVGGKSQSTRRTASPLASRRTPYAAVMEGRGPGSRRGLAPPRPPAAGSLCKCLPLRALHEGFISSFSFPCFLHRWFPQSQSPVAASKSFVGFPTLFSEGREVHSRESGVGTEGQAPLDSPHSAIPCQAECPLLALLPAAKCWPQTVLGLAVLISAVCPHTLFGSG